jgi:hypothetical protein
LAGHRECDLISQVRPRRLVPLAAALLIAVLAPAAAQAAETHNFINTDDLAPPGSAGTFGPANHYPSTIVVSGLAGTVTRATVTLIDLNSASADDIDMVLTGPNGQQVMLMSDACGEYPGGSLEDEDWTFEDSAQTFVPDGGPCAPAQQASFKPSNYLGLAPEPDDLSPGGGPAPPYVNALSFFNGSSPDGAWNLYMTDDTDGFLGFAINAWALTLDVEPPPPAPTPTAAPPTATPQKTGKRAAALARCKKKATKRARSRCRRRAKSLPA